MHFTTQINVSKKKTASQYLELATAHTNFLVGALAFNPSKPNLRALGNTLRKIGDVKVNSVNENEDETIVLDYSYDGEVVLDRTGLSYYLLELPSDIEGVAKLKKEDFENCSAAGYASEPSVFTQYWTPFNHGCTVKHYSVKASLEPVETKVTYPDYPRLVKEGVIKIAILAGKMENTANHNPYTDDAKDEERDEYLDIVNHLLDMGFVRTYTKVPADNNTSYEEKLEGTFGKTKMVVTMIFGNSIYWEEGVSAGNEEFYQHYLNLVRDSSFILYTGHAGFLVDPDGTRFYTDDAPKLDPNLYQIVVMNGCQTTNNLLPFFASKSSLNLDMIVNAKETTTNESASKSPIDAMITWAREGVWTSYPDLIKSMDTEKAMLGVDGEQDNPTEPYEVSTK